MRFGVALVVGGAVYLTFRMFAGHLPVSGAFIQYLAGAVAVIVAIIFSREIRQDIFSLNISKRETVHYSNVFGARDEDLQQCITETVRALLSLAKNNTGALLVFCGNNMPQHIIDSGTKLDAVVSSPLLFSIFNTKAPLHDGAVIIRGNRIIAAGCFLPLSQDISIAKELGTRHRAGIGISETVDVLTIIVSEETGVISTAKGGRLSRYYDSGMLGRTLEGYFGLRNGETQAKKTRRKWKV